MRDDGGPVSAWAEQTCSIFDRLMDLDRRSRVMITFMMSHMKEITGPLGVAPARYFRDCYEDLAQEFFQAAENSFVTHHCSRVLYGRWMALVEAARAQGLPMDSLDPDVMAGGSLIVPSGYQAVDDQLRAGVVPALEGPANDMLKPADCTLFERHDRIFGELELHSAHDWAEQVVLMWQLVQTAVGLRAQGAGGGDAAGCAEVARRYEEWRLYHIDSARIHSELFGRFSAGMFELVGERAAAWTLTPVLLHEMYLEVAHAFATLTGSGSELPALPDLAYWRRTPWTPAMAVPGASGLPPF